MQNSNNTWTLTGFHLSLNFSQVIATDEESGEVAHTSVDIEVLQRGLPGKFP